MDITLKNIKHAKSMSAETNAFTADVYVDGEFFCYARDNGQGGAIDFTPSSTTRINFPERLRKIEEYCKNSREPDTPYGIEIPFSFERAVGELVAEDLIKDQLRCLFNTRVVFVDNGKILELKVRNLPRSSPEKRKVLKQLGFQYAEEHGVKVLNCIAWDEALELFKKHA